jgi:hypothetical protein
MVTSYALNGGSPYYLQTSGTNWGKLARKLPGQDSRTVFFLVANFHISSTWKILILKHTNTHFKKMAITLPDFEIKRNKIQQISTTVSSR